MAQAPIKVNLSECPDVKCEACEGVHFIPAVRIKKISMIISPTGKEEMQPIQCFLCVKCSAELGGWEL